MAVGSTDKRILQARGLVGNSLINLGNSAAAFRTRARGILLASITTPARVDLTIATTHPTVPVRPWSRNGQVRRIPEHISHIEGRLVLAGDMNHWPRPQRADRFMHQMAEFSVVALGNDHTYAINRSRHAWLGRLIRPLVELDGQLDAMLYRGAGLDYEDVRVVDIASDHRAIMTTFSVEQD